MAEGLGKCLGWDKDESIFQGFWVFCGGVYQKSVLYNKIIAIIELMINYCYSSVQYYKIQFHSLMSLYKLICLSQGNENQLIHHN